MSYYGSNPSSPHTTNYRSYTGKPSTGPPTAPRPNPPAQNGYYQAIRPPVSSPPRHAHTHHAQPARVVEDEYLQDETVFFEQNRIKQLKNERIHIQKKTFTKWVNSYLNRVSLFYSISTYIPANTNFTLISGSFGDPRLVHRLWRWHPPNEILGNHKWRKTWQAESRTNASTENRESQQMFGVFEAQTNSGNYLYIYLYSLMFLVF